MVAVYILIGVLVGVVLFFLFGRKNTPTPTDNTALSLLLEQMNEMNRTLGQTSKEVNEVVRSQFSESQKLIRDINEQMNKSIIEVTKEQTKANEATRQFVTIAEQLSNLEKVLKHQKQRGNLGEASLELILSNILTPNINYKMQYMFSNGDKVDAIIITREGMIPVDAKFSLENYDRLINAVDDRQREELEKTFKNDLKKRIDETAKYIRPDEGTLSFAFMFIPAEGIYYDLLVGEVNAANVNARNLIDYAYNDKKVVIVSPTTFTAYLQSVLYGFKAYKIEQTAKDIIKHVDNLGKHIKSYESYHNSVGKAIGTAFNQHNLAGKELGKIDKDVLHITGTSPALDVSAIEKPSLE
jgi:DNA recombination protein RmuC